MIRRVVLVLLFVLMQMEVHCQQRLFKGHFFSLGVSYLEIKDELNHGLIFKGPDISLEYGFQNIDSLRSTGFSFLLAGGGKTAADSWGFRWDMSPINAHYLLRIAKNRENRIYLGPSFLVNYNVQNYPDLHAGPILWMTSYDLGMKLSAYVALGNRLIELHWRNTLLALCSRPEEDRDPYYFSTGFGENFSDIHSNMVFGTFNQYNQTELGAKLYFDANKHRKSLSYVFQYSGYFSSPKFEQVSHSIVYSWYFEKGRS